MKTTTVAPMAMRPRQAAQALAVSERTLFAWIRQNRIKAIKTARTVLIPVAEIERFLAGEPATSGK